MHDVATVPGWVLALVGAALAPFAARALASAIERRARAHTARLFAGLPSLRATRGAEGARGGPEEGPTPSDGATGASR